MPEAFGEKVLVAEVNFLTGCLLGKFSKILGGNYVLLFPKFIVDAVEKILGKKKRVLVG